MSEELKPCPFCGALDIDPDAEDDNGRFYVCCMNCWATASHYETKADAIAAWNTRVVDHLLTSNPVVDHETGNTSDKLRDAGEVGADVLYAAEMAVWDKMTKRQAAAAVIEADRQATRAALVSEIVAWLRGNADTWLRDDIADMIEAKWGKQ